MSRERTANRCYENPPDDLIARWLRDYGATGVKSYDLEHGPNEGCVAWYREMTPSERMTLARLDEIAEEDPNAYDVQRMVVASCLLWPSLDEYPFPPLAASELFGRIRQHGHGLLEADEPSFGEDKIPEHVVADLRRARSLARRVAADARYGSVYVNLAVRMATRHGSPDPQVLDWLLRLSPGRIREVAAFLEIAHQELMAEAAAMLEKTEGPSRTQKASEFERLRMLLYGPFEIFDVATAGATLPAETEAPAQAEDEEAPRPSGDDELLPDAPVTSGAALRRAMEG